MNRRDFIRTTLAGAAILPSATPLLSVPRFAEEGRRKRLRELGIIIGDLAPGPFNAITDVRGVKVGHTTIIKGKAREPHEPVLPPSCPTKAISIRNVYSLLRSGSTAGAK